MKPERIDLQAFGPFAGRQVIDFGLLGSKTFFLIHGPTGAGKTSILDAMCFALFGDSSGGERRSEQMRSHHADPATLTEVSFDFLLGERRYRVRRSPEQRRPSRRAGREALHHQTAELFRLDENLVEVPIATGWRRVTDEVVGLLGFESRQFRQVILLPQGQFFEFLKSTSQERERILQTLFGTEFYRRVAERLSLQAQEVERSAEEVAASRRTLLEQAQVDSEPALESLMVQRAAEVEQRKLAEERANRQVVDAEATLAQARVVEARFVELDEAVLVVATLEAGQAAQDVRRAALARSHAAAMLESHLAMALQAELAVKEGADALAGLKVQLDDAVRATDKSSVEFERQQALMPKIEEARREVMRLEGLSERAIDLELARIEREASERQSSEVEVERNVAAAALKAAETELEALRSEFQKMGQLATQVEGLQARARLADQLLARAELLVTEKAAVVTAAETVTEKEALLAAARAAADTATRLSQSMHADWLTSQSSRLAQELIAGQPCVVCGSTSHPAPAHQSGTADEFVSDESLQAAEKNRQDAQSTVHKAEAALDQARHVWRDKAQRVRDLELHQDDGIGTPVELKAHVEALSVQLEGARDAATRLEDLEERIASAVRRVESSLRVEAKRTESSAAEARARRERAQAIWVERVRDLPETLVAPGALHMARSQAVQNRDRLMEAFDSAREGLRSATESKVHLEARYASEEAAQATRQRHRDATLLERDTRLASAGFESPSKCQEARLGGDESAALDRIIRAFDADCASGRHRLDRARVAVGADRRPDLSAVELVFEQARRTQTDATRATAEAVATLERCSDLARRLRVVSAEFDALQSRHARVRKVADLANGLGAQRMSFQRYVLASVLEEVLAATSNRLRVMSRGRYEVQRATGPGDRRAAAGLDLEVFDHHTGVQRGVSTLSGGEQFLTSLALALGLSDVVQAHAGGIRLDAIFVDEGFGTLDTEALDLAIRALKDLQQSGRLVGIISHVSELREWIDARLEVRIGASGSEVRFTV